MARSSAGGTVVVEEVRRARRRIQLLLMFVVVAVIAAASALPPFEIRSSSGVKSEAAEEWLGRLERAKGLRIDVEPMILIDRN